MCVLFAYGSLDGSKTKMQVLQIIFVQFDTDRSYVLHWIGQMDEDKRRNFSQMHSEYILNKKDFCAYSHYTFKLSLSQSTNFS